MTIEQLTQEVLSLPIEQRALLADRLVESLDPVEDGEIRAEWEAEIERRVKEVRTGQAETIPADEVFTEVLAEARARRKR